MAKKKKNRREEEEREQGRRKKEKRHLSVDLKTGSVLKKKKKLLILSRNRQAVHTLCLLPHAFLLLASWKTDAVILDPKDKGQILETVG